MSIIRDLQIDKNGFIAEGKFDSTSLFNGEMAVSIFVDDGVTVEYADKCIAHYNNLSDNSDLLAKLRDYITRFFLYMYNEWRAMGIYEDIIDAIEPIIKCYKAGRNHLEYLSAPTLYVYPPNNDSIGYTIECDCPWEPEHQCLMIIRDDELLYVGQSDGLDPWGDEDIIIVFGMMKNKALTT